MVTVVREILSLLSRDWMKERTSSLKTQRKSLPDRRKDSSGGASLGYLKNSKKQAVRLK